MHIANRGHIARVSRTEVVAKATTLLILGTIGLMAAAVPASAVTPPAAYLTGYSYMPYGSPNAGLLAGTIHPAPSGQSNFLATRNTYDANGRLQKIDEGVLASWPLNGTQPTNWTGFSITTTTTFAYDSNGNKVLVTVAGSDGAITNVTQYSYDAFNRLTCTAVRMNPSAFNAPPASACNLGPQGSNGPDRITQNIYDALGRVTQIQRAVGTSLQENYQTNTYTTDGLRQFVTDANGNQSYFTYDGVDRLAYWYFPSPTSAGHYNAADYEQYGYDPNGNRTSLRKRDGQAVSYSYDALNRMATKTEPVASQSVTYTYDLRGLQTHAVFTSSGVGITNSFDGFGRRLSTTNTMGTTSLEVSSLYDLDGDLIRVTHPDGNYFQYTYDGDDRLTGILENGATSIVSQSYLPNGLRSAQSRGAVATSYGYQSNTLLSGITDTLAGTASVTTTFAYNPANELTTRMRTNDAYAFAGTPVGTTGYSVNGLNQYTNVGGAGFGYDGRGNLTSDGATTYSYDAENHLLTASGAHNATLTYDPLGRLYEVVSGNTTTQLLYDGDALVAEYDGSGALLQRYVHGPQADNPWIWYQGATVSSTTRAGLQVDHQGLIVSLADASGNALTINAYDEYGAPAAGNAGRFQFTGQAWLPELGLYYYKARLYDPRLGRFLQTDPVGYTDDVNLYAYVGNDPLDRADPSGNCAEDACVGEAIVACAASPPCAATAAATAAYVVKTAVDVGKTIHDHIVNNESAPSPSSDKPSGSNENGSTLQPGEHAGDSIPARGPGRDFTPEEREKINEIGEKSGCHTCGTKDPGTKSGNFVPDHQPPSAVNPEGKPQRLYPQCLGCSRTQGGEVRQAKPVMSPPPPPKLEQDF
jgi:RHS repeat-associated protein